MREQLDDLMCTRWPELYRGRASDQTNMHWGFAHGDGWFALVDSASAVITGGAIGAGEPVPEAVQVKEKLGTLRIYMHGSSEFALGAAWFADSMAGRLCEQSGRAGRLYSLGGYLQVIHPDLAKPADRALGAEDCTSLLLADAASPQTMASLQARHAGRYPGLALDIPMGWADIVDVLLRLLDGSQRYGSTAGTRCNVESMVCERGCLLVKAVGAEPSELGAVACAAALAARTDKVSGATGPVDDTGAMQPPLS